MWGPISSATFDRGLENSPSSIATVRMLSCSRVAVFLEDGPRLKTKERIDVRATHWRP
jgi:hypothetical protein